MQIDSLDGPGKQATAASQRQSGGPARWARFMHAAGRDGRTFVAVALAHRSTIRLFSADGGLTVEGAPGRPTLTLVIDRQTPRGPAGFTMAEVTAGAMGFVVLSRQPPPAVFTVMDRILAGGLSGFVIVLSSPLVAPDWAARLCGLGPVVGTPADRWGQA